MERRPHTQDARSSKPSSMKLNTLHILVSSAAMIAGVVIAGYQAFAPKAEGQLPLQVNVAVESQAAADVAETAPKSDGGTLLQTAAVALERNAQFAAALKDGSDGRYRFSDIFDGDPKTMVTIAPPDSELNILVTFLASAAQPVTAIEYSPPPGITAQRLATVLDVMVLPDGQIEASGRPVISFTLQQSDDSQTFAIPGHAVGRGLWLRISGGTAGEPIVVGDFSILREELAP